MVVDSELKVNFGVAVIILYEIKNHHLKRSRVSKMNEVELLQ